MWFETFELRENAFRRERQIKEWKRRWKIELIEASNPAWRDLYDDLNNLLGSEAASAAWVPAFAGMSGVGR